MKIDQLGPYRLERQLGHGGMGSVFEGVDTTTGQRVAVKVLRGGFSQEEGFRSRFAAEIEALRKLNHPGIVRLLGFGEQEGYFFYSMELVEGQTLDEALRGGRRFAWRDAVAMAISLCQALRHAHDRGIVHRDIKPGNLLLAADGSVKIADFGIARLFGQSPHTEAGSIVGTADFMSPEQTEGRPADPRSDLYSLGGVLYALVAGRPPFVASSIPEMLQMQRFSAPEPVRRFAPDVPEALEVIVGQLLEKSPERRIPTAVVLAKRLEQVLAATTPDNDAPGVSADGEASGFEPSALGDAQSAAPITADWKFDEPPTAISSDRPNPPSGEGAGSKSGRFTHVPQQELDPELAPSVPTASWQAAVLLLLLFATVGGTVWYFMRPVSADTLYRRIAAKTSGGDIGPLLDAESQIEEFLARFPEDERVESLRKHQKEIQLYRAERKIERRATGLAGAGKLTAIERTYLDALQTSRVDPDQGLARLEAMIALYGPNEPAESPAGQCLELARRRVEKLRREVQASAQEQLGMIVRRLDEADAIAKSDAPRAREIRKAVIQLYAGKPWANEAVERARAALAQHP